MLVQPRMPLPKMPQLRLRPAVFSPGDVGYEAWKKAARAKFDSYDVDKHGWLTDDEALDLAVDLYASLHETKYVSSVEGKTQTVNLLKRLGHVDDKIVFAEFLLWLRTVVEKMHKIEDAHASVDSEDKQVSVRLICVCVRGRVGKCAERDAFPHLFNAWITACHGEVLSL